VALLKLSTAKTRLFFLRLTNRTAAIGQSVTVTITKAGGAPYAPAGSVVEVGQGFYTVGLSSSDTNTLGDLGITCTATGCEPTAIIDQVVAFDPNNAMTLGVGALPNNTPDTNGGLLTFGTSSGQINPTNGNVTVAGYATGEDPGSLVLINPGDKLATDTAGRVILQPAGLDAVATTPPTGVAGTFREMLVALWRRFHKRVTRSTTTIQTYADDNTTVMTTQTYTSTGSTDDVGPSS
jgi:hypothetical protein